MSGEGAELDYRENMLLRDAAAAASTEAGSCIVQRGRLRYMVRYVGSCILWYMLWCVVWYVVVHIVVSVVVHGVCGVVHGVVHGGTW